MPVAALPDVVVMELPSDRGDAAGAAITSCNMVLGPGRCRETTEPGPAPTWHANLSFLDEAHLHARVEIHRTSADGALLSVRDITFEEGDSLEQRYRALGLLVVSHVIAADPRIESPPPTTTTPEPTPPTAPETRWGLDVGATMGPDLDDGLRVGGLLRGWMSPWGSPLKPIAAVGWSTSSGRGDATWLNGRLGLALRLEPSTGPVAFELRAEGVVERLEVSAEANGLAEGDVVFRYGAAVGLDVHLELLRGFGAYVGSGGTYMLPAVRLNIAGEEAGYARAPTWDIQAGIRISP